VDAADLYQDYKENATAADAKYNGKIIQVSGCVGSIWMEDLPDSPYINSYITLESSYVRGNVQCLFDKKYESQLAQMKLGDEVTVQGRCSGKGIWTVLIKDCTLRI